MLVAAWWIVQAKSQMSETRVLELIVNPSGIEAEAAAGDPGLGSRHFKCLPRVAGHSIKRGVRFSRACVHRDGKRGDAEIRSDPYLPIQSKTDTVVQFI